MMSKIIVFLVLLLALQLANAQFYSANDLVQWADADERISAGRSQTNDYQLSAELRGYVVGTFDSTNFLYCAPAGITVRQIGAIVQKYIRAHPERWSATGSTLVIAALKESFPCKK